MNRTDIKNLKEAYGKVAEISEIISGKKPDPIKGKLNFSNLIDVLDFVRVGIKDLKFDLEATRRERDFLKKKGK